MIKKLAYRADISSRIGAGHLIRLINFSYYLKLKKKDIFWLISGNKEISKKILNKKKFKNIFFLKNNNRDLILKILKKHKINTIIFDMAYQSNIKNINLFKYIDFFKKKNLKTISFDHPESKRMGNISIVPYLYKSERVIDQKRDIIFLKGTNYLVFPKKFMSYNLKKKKIKRKPKNILISLGGTDHDNLTYKLLKLIRNIKTNNNFRILSGFQNYKRLKLLIIKLKFERIKNLKVKLLESQQNMHTHLFWSDIAIIAEGLTKFEAAILGTPSIMINSVERDNSWLIKDFKKFNTTCYLAYSKLESNFNKIFEKYSNNFSLRKKHSKNGKKFFNFYGPKLILNEIKKIN